MSSIEVKLSPLAKNGNRSNLLNARKKANFNTNMSSHQSEDYLLYFYATGKVPRRLLSVIRNLIYHSKYFIPSSLPFVLAKAKREKLTWEKLRNFLINPPTDATNTVDLLTARQLKHPSIIQYFRLLAAQAMNEFHNNHRLWSIPILVEYVIPRLFHPHLLSKDNQTRHNKILQVTNMLSTSAEPILQKFQTLMHPGRKLQRLYIKEREHYHKRVQTLLSKIQNQSGDIEASAKNIEQAINFLRRDFINNHLHHISHSKGYLSYLIKEVKAQSTVGGFIDFITSFQFNKNSTNYPHMVSNIISADSNSLFPKPIPPDEAIPPKRKRGTRGRGRKISYMGQNFPPLGSTSSGRKNFCLFETLGITYSKQLTDLLLWSANTADRNLGLALEQDKKVHLHDYVNSSLAIPNTLYIRHGAKTYQIGQGPSIIYAKITDEHIERCPPFPMYNHHNVPAHYVGNKMVRYLSGSSAASNRFNKTKAKEHEEKAKNASTSDAPTSKKPLRKVLLCPKCSNNLLFDKSLHSIVGKCSECFPRMYDEGGDEEQANMVLDADFSEQTTQHALQFLSKFQGGSTVSPNNKCLINAFNEILALENLPQLTLHELTSEHWSSRDMNNFIKGRLLDSSMLTYEVFEIPNVVIGVYSDDITELYGDLSSAATIHWIYFSHNHFSYSDVTAESISLISLNADNPQDHHLQLLLSKFHIKASLLGSGEPQSFRPSSLPPRIDRSTKPKRTLIPSNPSLSQPPTKPPKPSYAQALTSPPIQPATPVNPESQPLTHQTPSIEEGPTASVQRVPVNQELSDLIFTKSSLPPPLPLPHSPRPSFENVGGYMYLQQDKTVIITPDGIKSDDSQFLSFKKITYAVEDYSTFEKVKNIHKTARVWFNLHKKKIGINAYWYTKNHKKKDVIFNPLLDHLWRTRSAGIFTEAAVQQTYYAAMNYTEVKLPTQLKVNTFHYFLALWASHNAQIASNQAHLRATCKTYLNPTTINFNTTQDNAIIKKHRLHDGIYGVPSDLPGREMHVDSDEAQDKLNNNYVLLAKHGANVETDKNGLITKFVQFHTNADLPCSSYNSFTHKFANCGTTIGNSPSETVKASLRLLGDKDGVYSSQRARQENFFATPGTIALLSDTSLEHGDSLNAHPIALAYEQLFDSFDFTHQVEDFVNAITEYIEYIGVKKEERYATVTAFLENPSFDYGSRPDEAVFKKWEYAKQKWSALENRFITKYGRLFTSLPGLKWLVSTPHWLKDTKDRLTETIVCEGGYCIKVSKTGINIIPTNLKPFYHVCVLYPVHGDQIQVNSQHLANQFSNCLSFCASNPGHMASLSHGDDCLTVTTDGDEWYFNSMDISNCDGSHTTLSFAYWANIFKRDGTYNPNYFRHYEQPIKIFNPANRKEYILIRPRFGKLGSGASTTTAGNSITSSILCIAASQGCLDEVGYTLTSEVTTILPKATFLAHYFYFEADGTVACTIDMSVAFKKYGLYKGDIARRKSTPITTAFDAHNKSVIQGYKNYPPNIILDSFRLKHGLIPPTPSWTASSTKAILDRLNDNENVFTELDLLTLSQRILKFTHGQIIVDRVVEAFLKIRYGYTSVSFDYNSNANPNIADHIHHPGFPPVLPISSAS